MSARKLKFGDIYGRPGTDDPQRIMIIGPETWADGTPISGHWVTITVQADDRTDMFPVGEIESWEIPGNVNWKKVKS